MPTLQIVAFAYNVGKLSAACLVVIVFNLCVLQQYDLERHSRSHRGEKPYKCYVCGRPFAMSHHLSNHMVTHTGVRAYCCLVCNKRFAQTFSLKRHMRMHLRAAESVAADVSTPPMSADGGFSVGGMALLQSLSCNICGKIFSSQQTLKRHRCQLSSAAVAVARRTIATSDDVTLVTRTPHQCRDCGVAFNSARHLNDHVTDAHPDRPKKPYACSDCTKSFAHPYSLKRHRVEHGGEAFVCPTCGKRFAQLYELSRHLKSHHVGRPLDDQQPGLASTANSHEMGSAAPLPVSATSLPSEAHSCFSMQIAKYVALQDAQTGLANQLLFRDGHLHKPGDVGLLAFAQSLVISSAPALHTATHSETADSTAAE